MSRPLTPPSVEQIDQLTRTLQSTLQELGYHLKLVEVTQEIPDARDRLIYVGQLTEEAAHKVLATVEKGLPTCSDMVNRGRDMAASIRTMAEGDISADACRAMLAQCAEHVEKSAEFAERQNELLTDIMMTQSFQDLSGQVIKKVVNIITMAEGQLLTMLADMSSELDAPVDVGHTLEGPQTPDKALKQDDVDDLMASLGF